MQLGSEVWAVSVGIMAAQLAREGPGTVREVGAHLAGKGEAFGKPQKR